MSGIYRMIYVNKVPFAGKASKTNISFTLSVFTLNVCWTISQTQFSFNAIVFDLRKLVPQNVFYKTINFDLWNPDMIWKTVAHERIKKLCNLMKYCTSRYFSSDGENVVVVSSNCRSLCGEEWNHLAKSEAWYGPSYLSPKEAIFV